MFKKIEIWILYVVILLSILFSFGFGVLVRQEIVGDTKLGKIDISFLSKPAAYLAGLPAKTLKQLLKPNSNRVNDPWDENRYFYNQYGFDGTNNSFESYILLCRYDGYINEGVVELIDLTNFEVLHTWNPDIDAFNDMVDQVDEFKYLNRDHNNSRAIPGSPYLMKDGNLLFGQIRIINECSKLVFQNTHDFFHHSIELDKEGNIWAPSYIYPQSLPVEKVGRDVVFDNGYFDDGIVKLNSNGRLLFEKSVSQIFIDNGLEYLLFAHGEDYEEDPIHLNDIQPVNFDGDFWKKGDVFLSLRNQSMIILFRPSTNQIIWKGTGPFLRQHDVNILDENRISIFNNRSINVFKDVNIIDSNNEVIVYNFKKDKYISYLKDSLAENDVRTITGGRSKILPNGDLLVEETNSSKILYFNADGSLRWTYLNRAENGNVYAVGWSRILYNQKDILTVKEFLKSRVKC